MCGRITRATPREAIAKEFGVTRFAEVDWHPRYNVAPSQIVETIISVNGEKRLGPMRWGFVSPTGKEPKIAPINARADPSLRARLDGVALETAKRHSWNSDAIQLFAAYERVSKRTA